MMPAANVPPYRNVFVLCTGRCGSQTFIRACEHFTNYTAGHETLSRNLGPARFDYPSGHIEADNRLAWFLGRLEKSFGNNAFYVHLKRAPEKVSESYDQSWDHRFSLISGYNRSILMQTDINRGAARDMVDTITANIDLFLMSKSNVIEIDIDAPEEGFNTFFQRIGAQGDISAALAEFQIVHNQRKISSQSASTPEILHPSQMMEKISDLQRINKTLSAEKATVVKDLSKLENTLKLVRTKSKKRSQILLLLSIPSIVVLSPILLPFYVLRKFQRNVVKKKTISVFDAFELHKEKGAQAAIDYLRHDENVCATGVIDLFAAMDADTDESWLSNINRWGGVNQIPKITLSTDVGTRFSRMRFENIPSVPSPDLVTVIIPCFNCESSVTQSVESILGQTWTNMEIIAVDDASTDKTGVALDALALRDPRLRVLHNAVNVGPYVSKNRALQQARGSYVTGHDGDDISLPDRIEKQVSSLRANGTAVATISYMVRLNEAGQFDGPTKTGNRSYDGITRLCPISMMCDTEILRNVMGGWDCVRFGGDSELIERMTLALGDKFVRDERIALLCLSSASGLTNDPVHGINTPTGLSPSRRDYVKNYRAWHSAVATDVLHLPFPHIPRKFAAPPEMLVSAEVLNKILDLP